jgi:hypothetical protein
VRIQSAVGGRLRKYMWADYVTLKLIHEPNSKEGGGTAAPGVSLRPGDSN